MTTLNEVGENTFSWRPVRGGKHLIEVYVEDAVFGTLRQERGTPALADVDGNRWVFERGKDSLRVCDEDGSALATFVAGKGNEGVLTLPDGQTFRWAPTHRGRAERAFYDDSGARLVRFWKDHHWLKTEDRGAAEPGVATRPEFPLLVVLGRVIGIGEDDDGTMAAIIAATSM